MILGSLKGYLEHHIAHIYPPVSYLFVFQNTWLPKFLVYCCHCPHVNYLAAQQYLQ